MRIDAHQHFWNYSQDAYGWISNEMPEIRKSFGPDQLQPLLEENDLDACVSVQARQSIEENEYLLSLAGKYDFIKGVVGWVDLRSDKIEEDLKKYQVFPKMKGFRHVLQDEPDDNFMLQNAFVNGVKKSFEYGYTYDILIYETQLPSTVKFLEHFDSQAFVLDHIAKPMIKVGKTRNWEKGIRTLAQYKQLYCKISGMVTEAKLKQWKYEDFLPFLDIIVDTFGVDRIMFGSDWPVCLLGSESYGEMKGIIDRYFQNYTEEDRAKIFGGNAISFYKL
ncbi:MAG: amidohydrolase family protein [Bacteroidota bacterium]